MSAIDYRLEAVKIEAELRATWDAQGVPRERQDAVIADITAKAQSGCTLPGALRGPFAIRAEIRCGVCGRSLDETDPIARFPDHDFDLCLDCRAEELRRGQE